MFNVHVSQVNADDEEATKVILAALKKRFENTGRKPILIHTVRTFPINRQ